MTEQQFASIVRAFARQRPFREFVIEFTNGEKVAVRHPEGVAPVAKVWLLQQPDGLRELFASTSVCRVLETKGARRP